MYTLTENLPEYQQINSECKEITAQIAANLTPEKEDLPLLAGAILTGEQQDTFYLIKEGAIFLLHAGKKLLIFDEGDLVGIEAGCSSDALQLEAEFAIRVDQYSHAQLYRDCVRKPELFSAWNKLLALRCRLSMLQIAAQMRDEPIMTPNLRYVAAGETIMSQGDPADSVFTMIDGDADVLVNGVQVGSIGSDEIFGAMACLTGTTRSATVIAASRCAIAEVSNQQFFQLIAARPHAVLDLLKDMARTISGLNEKVVKAEKAGH